MFRRTMAFAGSWYPAEPDACRRAIEAFAAQDAEAAAAAQGARWGVVPHAGWVYSGAVAARVFRALAPRRDVPLAIVLGGHLRADDPVVAMEAGTWETPFGPLTVHSGFDSALATLPNVVWDTPRHNRRDNSTELQLPFVKHHFPAAELLVLRVPPGPDAVRVGAALADYLARSGLQAVGVASTDLTHYGPHYGFEPKGRGPEALRWVREQNDPAFIDAVAGGDAGQVLAVAQRRHNACSAGGVAALMALAAAEGAAFAPLAYATSADARPGDRDNFVGYLGGIFS